MPNITVSGSAPGARLEFFEGVSPLGALSVDRLGQASFTVQGLSPGAHSIFAKERVTGTQAGEVLHVTIPAAATDRFSSAAGSALGIQPTAFAAGDLNRDGTADFVAAGNGYVSLLSGLGTGLFSPVIFAAVADPTAVLIADFNGDGWNDVAVAGAAGQIAILLNDGSGGLKAPRFYNSGAHPSALAIADFNGDGIPDLVVADEGDNDVSLLAGRDDGTFAAAVNFNAGLGPRSIAVGDLNGDGFADLAVADFAGNEITILLGDGKGGFRNAGSLRTGNGPSLVLAGDFNEDGSTDLAVLNQLDQSAAVLLGNGTGQFSPATSFSGAISLAAGHILGGSHLDLVIQAGSQLQILTGAGNGTFSTGPVLGTSAAPQSILLADFNGDGRLDAAAADLSGVLSVFTGAAASTVASAPIPVQTAVSAAAAQPAARQFHALASGTTPSSITLSSSSSASNLGQSITLSATLTSQAPTGTITFYNGTSIISMQPVSQGQASFTTALLPSGVNPLTARYSGDSTFASSLSSPISQTVSALPQSGFQGSTSYSTGATPMTVVTADFNGDGKPDVAVTNEAGSSISVFLNNGNGGFAAGVSYSAGSQPYGLVAVDLNDDGYVDLVVTNASSSSPTVTVLLGTGTGTFSTMSSYATGSTPESIAAADFNGDGIADLVVANEGAATVGIFLGNGDGTLQPAVFYATGTTPTSVAVADFNGDGIADVVTANSGSANVSVLLGNGDGTLQAAVSYAAGTQPTSVLATDLNGDGKPDLAVANALSSGSNVSVLLNSGSGTFPTRTAYAAGVSPHFVTTGDFNADGIPDLLVINKGSPSTFSVLYGSGSGLFQTAVTTSVGTTAWSAAVSDYNGDGRSDFVVASSGSNKMYLLLGNGVYPDLTVALANSGTFSQGQTGATYTVTATNSGPGATSGLVTMTDALPTGLTATAIGGTGWSCSLAALSCTRNDALGAGLSYPAVTVTVNVAGNAGLSVTNTVTVAGGGEINASNDSANDVTNILQTTTLALISSLNPSSTGQSIALTATVSSTAATGTVVFYDGLVPIATEVVNTGTAVLNTALLGSGTHVLAARYSGDTQYLTSASASLTQTVDNQPQNGFQTGVNYALGSVDPSAVTVADFNGDGWPDIAVANSTGTNRVMVLLNKGGGTGTFGTPISSTGGGTNSAPYGIVAADFNGDGIMDLAVANNGTNTVSVLLGTGNGSFQSALNTSAGTNPRYLVAGDFNNDGLVDLAVVDYGSAVVTILLGNGNGTFQTPASTNAVGTNPSALVLGDFNGDGIADLAVTNYGSGTISVLLGKGGGLFQPAVSYSVAGDPQALALGDFNGDGIPDLAVGSSGSNTVGILLGLGNGTFSSAASYAAGGSASGLVARDFNGDGVLDLAVTNPSVGVSLLLGVGNGGFQSPLYYTAGTSPIALAASDFNEDGLTDLVVANQSSGNVTVLLGGLYYSDVTIFSSHTGNFIQGQNGDQYTVTVMNVGQYPTVGTVTARDVLPRGMTATAIAGTGWTCALTGLSCTRSDALEPGASYPSITVTVNVAANANAQLTNTATVSGGYENNSANDTATDVTTVIQTTTLSLASSNPGWYYDESVTLTATISSTAATGTVTFWQGSTSLGSATVSGGSASIPGPALTPGSYTFTATYSGDAVYAGSTGTLSQTVGKAPATVTLSNLRTTWTGSPWPATVTTNPAGLNVTVTYNGSTTVPSNAGTYPVVATVNDPNYAGSATGSLVISPAQATITLSALSYTYDGTPKSATATTNPSGLAVSITYGGNSSPPASAGSYAVAAAVTTPNYTGTATGTLVISPAPVTVTLSGFNAAYNGNPQPVGVVTNPAGIAVTVTYNGSTTVPTAAGSYAVSAAPSSANYSGSASGTLVISQASATFTLGNLSPIYNGSAQAVTVSVAPAGVAYSVKYNGAFAAPTAAGSYNVVIAVTNPNYTGGASATLTIQKATPVIVWAQPAAITFGSALGANQLNATSATPGTFQYTPGPGTVPQVGAGQTLSAVFSPTDAVDYNSVTAATTITVNPTNVQGTLIMVTRTLSRDGNNNIVVNIVLANGGSVSASNLVVTVAKIASTPGAPLPIGLGTLAAGNVVQTSVTVPGSAGVTGALEMLTIGGTFTGGNFSASGKVYLP